MRLDRAITRNSGNHGTSVRPGGRERRALHRERAPALVPHRRPRSSRSRSCRSPASSPRPSRRHRRRPPPTTRAGRTSPRPSRTRRAARRPRSPASRPCSRTRRRGRSDAGGGDGQGRLFEEAQAAFDEQAYITEKLQTQADDAQGEGRRVEAKAAAMLAELGKTGGGDLTASLLASSQSGDADDLPYRLGAMDQYTERSQDVYTQAVQEQNNARGADRPGRTSRKEARGAASAAAKAASRSRRPPQKRHRRSTRSSRRTRPSLEAQLAVLVEKRQGDAGRLPQRRPRALGRQRRRHHQRPGLGAPVERLHSKRVRDALSTRSTTSGSCTTAPISPGRAAGLRSTPPTPAP